MKPFSLHIPTEVHFGNGVSAMVGDILRALGLTRVFIVTGGKSAEKSGGWIRVMDSLDPKTEVIRFAEVRANPTVEGVMRAIERARSEKVQAVVSIGGGSAIDVGKAVAVGVHHTGPFSELLGHREKSELIAALPHIAIPTTAGTGSECSMGAIITDDTGMKQGLRGKNIFPSHALIDPELTLSMGPQITAESGFDAFAHALETYVSLEAKPFTEELSKEVLPKIFKALPRVLAHPDDLEARTTMSYCSALMGINLAYSSTCLPHRLQYALASVVEISHAEGMTLFYPAWVEALKRVCPEKMARVEEWLEGGSIPQFIHALGFKKMLKDVVSFSDISLIEKRLSGNLASDPVFSSISGSLHEWVNSAIFQDRTQEAHIDPSKKLGKTQGDHEEK